METENDERREGDERPTKHKKGVSLTLTPAHDEPFRWLPKHGEPSCIGEWASQHFIKTMAWWPVYTGTVSTLILIIIILHPLGLGE